MPFISFIISVYNIKKYLPDCIDSVFAQPFGDWEIVLVDDKSTDGSAGLCDDYAATYSQITVIHLPENSGPGIARNKGLEKANGLYVFFLDGDDTIVQNELSNLCRCLKNNNLPDIVKVGWRECWEKGDFKRSSEDGNLQIKICGIDDFLSRFIKKSRERVGFRAWELVIKTQILKENKIQFSPVRIGEDKDFTMQSLFAVRNIGVYERKFYNWRIRLAGSLTSNHTLLWRQIISSAVILLEYPGRKSLSHVCDKWLLQCVNTCILEFETIAGVISGEALFDQYYLFKIIKKYLNDMKDYIVENGLLWNIKNYGVEKGVILFCKRKANESNKLLTGVIDKDLFIFPTTHKTIRLMSVLIANGHRCKGLLDNDVKKQGLIFNGLPIFNPDIFPLSYENNDKVFVIIFTSTVRTSEILSEQLKTYGLEEGANFIIVPPEP